MQWRLRRPLLLDVRLPIKIHAIPQCVAASETLQCRQQMNCRPLPHQTAPIQCPAGRIPIGCPTPSNPSVVNGAIQQAEPGAAAPFAVVRRPVREAQQAPRPPPQDHTTRKHCIKCGLRNNKHRHGELFGSKCQRSSCGICGMRHEFHEEMGAPMGWHCRSQEIQQEALTAATTGT